MLLRVRAVIISSGDPEMSKREHVALTIPQELEIMRRHKSGEIEREVALCSVRISKVCDKETEGLTMIIYSTKWKCEGPFQVPDIERAQVLGQ